MDRKSKKMGDVFDSISSKKVKQEELEVTGVSRCGRVRKKSSKLMDFESPDEIDIRASRRKDKNDFSSPNVIRQMKKPTHIKQEPSDDEDVEANFSIKEEQFSDESDMGYGQNEDSSMESMESDMEELDEGDLEREEPEGFQPISADLAQETPPQAQSLYMLEKSNKKKLVIKDGKIVGRMKAQRKDKGKTRFTAYMLWAKEIRQELMKSNPDLDFSQTSKKLGELWATVPFNEKYIWKRRANRLAAKGNIRSGNYSAQILETGKKSKISPGRKFINKQSQKPTQDVIPSHGILLTSPTESKGGKQSQGGDPSSQAVFKPVRTNPIDVAAHLRLLGESLTIVGERLTEHEGQIAVSGSFSVFLDSLLCALVSLLCLTQQVPELNVIPQDRLSQSMDNIAYIMPGL